MIIRRGDIFYADLSPVVGSEQGGLRPVLIIQNDVGNKYSPTVIAAAITSRMGKTRLPTHIDIYAEKAGLAKDSVILLEQIRTLDKRRLKEKMGHLDDDIMNEVNSAIAISFGLGGILTPEDQYADMPGAAAAVIQPGEAAVASTAAEESSQTPQPGFTAVTVSEPNEPAPAPMPGYTAAAQPGETGTAAGSDAGVPSGGAAAEIVSGAGGATA